MASGAVQGLPTLVMPLDPNLLMNVLAAQCVWFFVPRIVELKMQNLFWLCTMLGTLQFPCGHWSSRSSAI